MADASSQPRAQTVVLTALTTLALAMSAVGLYGVVAFSVAQRTREIGVRIALGASRRHVLLMALREGATIGVLGLLVGVAAALAVVRLLTSSLYGISSTDPVSFLAAAALLIVVAIVAATFRPDARLCRSAGGCDPTDRVPYQPLRLRHPNLAALPLHSPFPEGCYGSMRSVWERLRQEFRNPRAGAYARVRQL